MEFDGGSFRDPAGRVITLDGRILRAIFQPGIAQFDAASESGLLADMIADDWLLPAEPVVDDRLNDLVPGVEKWVEHPSLDFVSYPYEWCFSGLKSAALHHLNFHLALLARSFSLSDATAYNIQFRGTKPVFIDHLSIIPYEEGSGWIGQRQFGMQFLNPLFLWSKKGVSPLPWFRGSVEGIAPEDLSKLLGIRDRLSFTVLAQILGPAAVTRKRIRDGTSSTPGREIKLPKSRFVAILTTLRDYISDLTPPIDKTIWSGYAANNSYDKRSRAAKEEYVSEFVRGSGAGQIFDLGCNTGDYSQVALDAGAQNVVGFDFDLGALERAFARFDANGAAVLPLWLDAMNPSPAQGWAGAERKSLHQRASGQSVLALAVIHHLCIAKNVPVDMAVGWIMGLAPTGVIEFPSKSDAMVQLLMQSRPDIFPDYTEDAFLRSIRLRGEILRQERLGYDGRLIVSYRRHDV